MKIKLLIHVVVSVAALFSLSSCFQSETTVHVKADGSGTVVEEIMLHAQMSAMLGSMMQPSPDGKPAQNRLHEIYSEEDAKEKASEMGEGVTFVKLVKLDKDGKKGSRITYAFEDINKLRLRLGSGSDDMVGNEADKGKKAEKKIDLVRFELKNDNLTILMPKPDENVKAENADAADETKKNPQAEAIAKAMIADMKMSVQVVVEPGIKKSDATYVDGNTITLMDMNFDEIMKNEKGMGVLDQMEGKSPEEIAELLKDVKGVKIESKEKIKVQMK